MLKIVNIFPPRSGKPMRGAGDWLEHKLHPIAKAINWPCLDDDKESLRPNSPCAKMRDGLNRLAPSGASEGKPGA